MQVTMLTTPECVQCRLTAQQLDRHGIAYQVIDVTESEAALAWAQEHDFFAAPIVVIGDMGSEDFAAWTGFRPDRIAALAAEGSHE